MAKKTFKKSDIDRDFKELNDIIYQKLEAINLKYGKALILVQQQDSFNIGCVIDRDYLDLDGHIID